MKGNLRLAGKATTALVIVSALLALSILSSCKGKQGSADVMAKVNGRKILRSEVDKYFNAQVSGSPQKPTSEQADSLKLSILR